jgi:CRISPR-associated endonuclease/helicase Cas3
MHFAHSLEGRDSSEWQPLQQHLQAVSSLTSSRAQKFGAEGLGALVGLLHDLGKYSREFQDYIAGKHSSPDHATAGARQISQLVSGESRQDRFAAMIGAYCIAGHHAGLPDWGGERALSDRLKKELPVLDPVWRSELAPAASNLLPKNFKWHADPTMFAFQLAMLGRMVFSCLADADFRDTECFYTEAKGERVDRDWPALPDIVDALLGRFDAYMAELQARPGNTTLKDLRADVLAHARGKATLPRGVFTLNVPTGGGKTLASLGFALAHAKAHGMDRIIFGIPFAGARIETRRKEYRSVERMSLPPQERGSKQGLQH